MIDPEHAATAPSNPTPGPIRKVFGEITQFAKEEPLAAVAAVCAVGLLAKLLPTRWIIATATVATTAIVRPALISLGLTKAMELYCQKPAKQTPLA